MSKERKKPEAGSEQTKRPRQSPGRKDAPHSALASTAGSGKQKAGPVEENGAAQAVTGSATSPPGRESDAGAATGLPANLIQEASAGTGKTFALSSRYLQLLFCGVDPASILATTFTRAAAGEILDRIVSRLARGASDAAEAALLGGQLGVPVDVETARRHLVQLMQRIHELSVGTIDSFFYRLARAYSFELRLPSAWELADHDQLRPGFDRAIQQVLAERGTSGLLNLLSQTDGDRQISAALERIVEQMFELFQQAPASAWELGSQPLSRPTREETASLVERMLDLPVAGQLARAVGKDRERLEQGQWLELAQSSLMSRVESGDLTYYRSPLPEAVVELYRELGRMFRAELLGFNRERNRSVRQLLERFAGHYGKWQRSTGRLGFSDVGQVLHKLMAERPASMAFRLGSQVRHLLLDEFQDTSPQQWSVLQPLSLDAVARSEGGTFFCVGDPKQSIYGWRGGVAEMFEVVREDLGARVRDADPLVASRRSAPAVIDLVNAVFGNLPRFPDRDPAENLAIENWQAGFVRHSTVHTGMPGQARVLRASVEVDGEAETGQPAGKTSSEDKKAAVDALVVRAVQQVVGAGAAGAPLRSVGVLVRTHDDAARLIFRLRQSGISCSEEGGNPLTDSAAVNVLLAALRMADHPSDSVSGFLVSHSPVGRLLGLAPPTSPRDEAFVGACHRAARDLRARLCDQGYGETVYWMARALFPEGTERERARIELLVNEATAFDLRGAARPSVFVEWIESKRISDPSSASVRVMTIHRSKGLEFDAVIAPMYGSRSGWHSQTPPVVYSRDPRTRRIDRILRYVNRESREFLPEEIRDIFRQFEQSQVREAMCLLYVMLTRAVRDLTVIVGPDAKSRTAGPEGLLLGSLEGQASESSGSNVEMAENGAVAEVLYQTGDPQWFGACPEPAPTESGEKPQSGDAPPVAPTSLPVGPVWRVHSGRGLNWRNPSRDTGGRVSGSSLLGLDRLQQLVRGLADPSSSGRRHGIIMHAMLQQITWADRIPEQRVLEQAALAAGADARELAGLLDAFRQLIERPGMQELFDRQRYLDHVRRDLLRPDRTLLESLSVEVWNESGLLLELDGQVVDGSIDRMLLIREGRRLIAVELIDFKTDDVPVEAVQSRVRVHSTQLQIYRKGTAVRFSLQLEQVVARLVFLSHDLHVAVG